MSGLRPAIPVLLTALIATALLSSAATDTAGAAVGSTLGDLVQYGNPAPGCL
ncbi:MAG: hypothetical protein QOI02_1530, partial [Actinomycetota bacterium]|nr:hypothetical protein [Actinomycetota bacterium]